LWCVCVCVCVLAVYNKAQAQRISNREKSGDFSCWDMCNVSPVPINIININIFPEKIARKLNGFKKTYFYY